jgi:catechol 2,3-dioxygenase-like lactoylglutathione lyase family enzyme
MPMRLLMSTLVVPDYDAAIAFFCDALGFDLVEDTDLGGGKRWVRVAPHSGGAGLLLAKAASPEQAATIGRQAGGRVAFFVESDDFDRDHARMIACGVRFRESPRRETYGIVAVFEDPWGNPWDLIQLALPGKRG